MDTLNLGKHSTFYAIGLSYKKADAEMRGKFSLDENAKENLLNQAKKEGIESLFVTSTCNRTEIYGFAQHPFQLIKLLCENSQGTVEDFQKVAYVYKNKEALNHNPSIIVEVHNEKEAEAALKYEKALIGINNRD